MFTNKRILAGLASLLLISAGIGAGIAATEGQRGGALSEPADSTRADVTAAGNGEESGSWSGRRGRAERHARMPGGPDEKGDMGHMGHMGRMGGRGGPMHADHDGMRGRHGMGGPRPPMTQEDIDARVRERFARLDRNSDGVIDRAEIEATMAQGGRRGPNGMRGSGHGGMQMRKQGDAPRGGHMLGRFDENRDGKVAKEEFLGRVKRRFAEMDLDGDGKITDADLPPMLRGIGVLAGSDRGGAGPMAAGGEMGHSMRGGRQRGMGAMLGWLRSADANRDGVITLEEVTAQADKQFARLDRNSDGVLDPADREAMRKEMADYRVLRFLHVHGATQDGKVTREQFTKVAKERWARMDHAGDGRWAGRRGGRGMGPMGGPGGGPAPEAQPLGQPSQPGQPEGATTPRP